MYGGAFAGYAPRTPLRRLPPPLALCVVAVVVASLGSGCLFGVGGGGAWESRSGGGSGSSGGASTAVRACALEDVETVVSLRGGERAVRIDGSLETSRRATCRVRTSGRVALLDAAGDLLPVRGNPAQFGLWGPLDVAKKLGFITRWRNWCGPRKLYVLRVTILGAPQTARVLSPRCLDRGRRSTLGTFG